MGFTIAQVQGTLITLKNVFKQEEIHCSTFKNFNTIENFMSQRGSRPLSQYPKKKMSKKKVEEKLQVHLIKK